MRKTNKKGFTLVELVIVIAVIGILAGVLIPTFTGVTQKAEEAAEKADAKALYTQYMNDVANEVADVAEAVDADLYILVDEGDPDESGDEIYYIVVGGEVEKADALPTDVAYYLYDGTTCEKVEAPAPANP